VLRLYQSARVPAIWVGLGLGVAYLALWLAWGALLAALGRTPPWAPGWPELRWELVNASLMVYLLTANAYAVQHAERDLRALRPQIAGPEADFTALVERATHAPRPLLRVAGVLGAVLGFLLVSFDPGVWGGRAPPGPSDPVFLWVLFRNVLMSWCGWRTGATELVLTRGFALAARRVAIDVLDARPLAAFARKSQRSVVVWVGFSMILSLFWLGEAAGRANIFILVMILSFLAVVFLAPLFILHGRLAAAKHAELERVNGHIRSAARRGQDPGSGPRLADWIAYRRLLEDAPEWPINAPALARSTLFVAIGMGSWLGGALVERLLGLLLD
jgi:hypothetical protein